ncbi:MAG: hypothetical protein JWL97_3482 [Gemmatimonadales bacterium]|jgi:hypothetical protein|nr:hypothetical protein [Gemmatimonadales bacterium]
MNPAIRRAALSNRQGASQRLVRLLESDVVCWLGDKAQLAGPEKVTVDSLFGYQLLKRSVADSYSA